MSQLWGSKTDRQSQGFYDKELDPADLMFGPIGTSLDFAEANKLLDVKSKSKQKQESNRKKARGSDELNSWR